MDPRLPIAALALIAAVTVPALLVDHSDLEALRIEAEGGNREALFRYGISLMEGREVDRDERRAVAMWTEAALLGHAPSAAALAGVYRTSGDDPDSRERCRYWTSRAADLGHPDAMLALSGEANGRGDLVEAAVWLRLADGGSGRWRDRAGEIEGRLDPDAKREVDRRCGEWMSNHRTVSMID